MSSMKIPSAGLALTLVSLLGVAAAQGTQAAPTARSAAQVPSTAAQARGSSTPERAPRASRRKPRIVHLPSPSEESPAQRDRRLARECRGLPNAGACLGHALADPRARPPRR